jgi:hypothetical protein
MKVAVSNTSNGRTVSSNAVSNTSDTTLMSWSVCDEKSSRESRKGLEVSTT